MKFTPKILPTPFSDQTAEKTIKAIWGVCVLAIVDPDCSAWACEQIADLLRGARFIPALVHALPRRPLPSHRAEERVDGCGERHFMEPA